MRRRLHRWLCGTFTGHAAFRSYAGVFTCVHCNARFVPRKETHDG